MKVEVPKRRIVRPNQYTDMVQRVLQWANLIYFSSEMPFLDIKKWTHSLFGAWSFFLVHI